MSITTNSGAIFAEQASNEVCLMIASAFAAACAEQQTAEKEAVLKAIFADLDHRGLTVEYYDGDELIAARAVYDGLVTV